ncbi:MAG: hypothetical protein II776_03820, partial [Clostridia bacterium]|nr:hypothetical protein [Clostridia bacterium]
MPKNNVPIFYACDDAFVKFTMVSMRSLIDNASKNYEYTIYILHAGISDQMRHKAMALTCDNVNVVFVDVSERIYSISDKLPIRDYYSKTTYYRMYIADMFPEYDKAVYIDSDTIVQGDISELYLVDMGDNLVAACKEQAMIQTDNYGTYAEQVVGVSRYSFFNAGVLLINCKVARERKILEKFSERVADYDFVVTQDE